MSVWDSISGFANGVRDSLAGGLTAWLCREIGWKINEVRDGAAHLKFRDSNALEGVRDIVVCEDTAPFARVYCISHAILPSDDVPAPIMIYALLRNNDIPLGKWGVHVSSSKRQAVFVLDRWALAHGLDAAAFKVICESTLNEVSEFDARMRKSGLMRW